jgi:hypothetical protein
MIGSADALASANETALTATAGRYQDWYDVFNEFAAFEAVGTDDVLCALLPLMRQTLEYHEAGLVAPLDGVDAIGAHYGRLFFGPGKGLAGKESLETVMTRQGMAGALDLSGGRKRDTGGDPIEQDAVALDEPAHFLNYRCWEHSVGHHDTLTDIYSLGMLAASLATGLDFSEPDSLRRFAQSRHTLARLNLRLHPAAARVIVKMTALDRRDREQDLAGAIAKLEGYRRLTPAPSKRAGQATPTPVPPITRKAEQSPEKDRAQSGAVADSGPAGRRRQRILSELRGRLYDVSKRNRLIFYRKTASELDLTETSTPLVMRADVIREEQIFTLESVTARALLEGDTVALGAIIRFDEMAHAVPALDKLRAEDRRDQAEFGLSQLRLIIGFLDWRNLKADPETPIRSPLLLLPVALKKRRGVRDSYELSANGAEAEVNPTLRRYLQLLYGVELPRTVDLAKPDAVTTLHAELAAAIARTEPGVTLTLHDRPNLAELHKRATRRVDLYKKRAKPTSAAKRFYGDLEYTYQKHAFQPLGVQLYKRFVAGAPAPSSRTALDLDLAIGADIVHVTGTNAAPAILQNASTFSDPYAWAIDLCALTLSNLNYRRMSLVRDFDALLSGAAARLENFGRLAFDEIFADRPKPMTTAPPLPPLAERRPVTITDPTQDAAVIRARDGESFVIQGPPGAGKSQTIANLIADQITLGRRILFVCEKRAALDVVLRRLDSVGLADLCACVHDTQGDKKVFVQELKRLFDTWSKHAVDPAYSANEGPGAQRERALGKIDQAISRLTALDHDMHCEVDGEPTHSLLSRASATLGPMTLDDEARARAPSLREWSEGRAAAKAVAAALQRVGAEPVLARHPARFVSAEACADPNLFNRLATALNAVGPHLERMADSASAAVWTEGTAPLAALFAQIDYATRLEPVARAGKLSVFNVDSNLAINLKRRVDDYNLECAALRRARERTTIWREKLNDIETHAALALARRYEGRLLGFLSKPWREAKGEVYRRCDLDALKIKPRIQDLLMDLAAEQDEAALVARRLREIGEDIGVQDGAAALAIIQERDARAPAEGVYAAPLLECAIREPGEAEKRIAALSALKSAADQAREALANCLDGLDALPIDSAFAILSELRSQRDILPAFAPALRALSKAPDSVRVALRRIDAEINTIEQAIVDLAAERALIKRPALREAQGAEIDAARETILEGLAAFQHANAGVAVEAARERFLNHIHLTQRLELELSADERVLRRDLVESRRELERELAKSQRYRSIRELLAGPAGLFIRDLKPVWMMSPLSVADVLPLEADLFDLVIFDEASQVTAEAAAPSLFRAGQAVIVGDEKQMPPSHFFTASVPNTTEDDAFGATHAPAVASDDSALMQYTDLDTDSLLAQASLTLPSTLLGWHYRSRSEELIAFSNTVFYGGALITIPSLRIAQKAHAIIAHEPIVDAQTTRDTLERSISFHHTPFGRFESRRNIGEAAYVAELVRSILREKTEKTIGIVAFSEAHAAEIERAVSKLAKKDAKFRRAFEAESEREVDGAYAGLFIKNLENVQGDERDIMVISVGYAPDGDGRFRLNFGPVNREGGEKRLNVLFTRAKEHLVLVSSIKADDIGTVANDGALCLKSYLAYADAASRGDAASLHRVLSGARRQMRAPAERVSPLAEPIARALRRRGYVAETALGRSHFTVDLAVRRLEDPNWCLAVLIDGPSHYDVADPLERYVLRPRALAGFGWNTMTVLAVDWRRDKEIILSRIEKALAG